MEMEKPSRNEQITSAEIGKLWVTYMGNTMGRCILSYYLKHVEDEDIKRILNHALELCKKLLERIEEIFNGEKIPIPTGFTDEDVNLDAPRLFLDEFYLHYLRYTSKAGLNIYSIAIPLMTRKDIVEFFYNASNETTRLIIEVNKVLLEKGFIMKPPQIPIPEQVDFIKSQSYLNGVFGTVRPLHALEITHLYDNIDNNVTSKALLVGFSQVAKDEQVRQYFIRGKNLTDKHIKYNSKKLHKDNLPAPSYLDHLVTTSTFSPFSDKIMLAHKIDMFSMKIRSYGNATSLNGRRDIGGMYARLKFDIGLYVEDGANLMISRGWMEQPPKAADRDDLAGKHN